jgi:hypothetical protein
VIGIDDRGILESNMYRGETDLRTALEARSCPPFPHPGTGEPPLAPVSDGE